MKKLAALVLVLTLLLPWPFVSASETPSGIALSDIEGFVDDYMEEYIGESSPGAAVVLVKDGEIIFSKGYGYADLDNQIPVDSANTVFEYGSVSKLFVYTAIMRLAEQGSVDLDADIRGYLPEGFLKKLNYDKPVTMLNIMSHTAGFEDYLFDVILTSPENLPALEEVLRDFQPVQVYEPGTVSAYSNYAVALAAYIAEQKIGREFYEYLMDTMFLPLEMNSTSAHITLEDKPELLNAKARGYFPGKNGGFKLGPWSYVLPYPAGSVTGTAEDLARFAMALMPEEGEPSPLLAERETLDEMLSQSYPMGPGLPGFAHGFIEWDGGEFRALGHGGNTAAFSTQMNIVPQERFGVIVLTNVAGESHITSGLTEALIGKRDKTIPVSPENLPDAGIVEGSYVGARRMHTGFLDLYGYLTTINVQAVDSNTIQLKAAGQTSTLVQTSPYVFKRVQADGPILKYHFGTVYFEVKDGEVVRMSGDYLPLPGGRTRPWLLASLCIAAAALLFFTITPLALLIVTLRRRKKGMADWVPQNRKIRRVTTLLVLSGTALVFNNLVLIARMLVNNYRSFAQLRNHILLNYPLAVLAAVLCVLMAMNWRGANLSRGRKVFLLLTVAVLAAFIGLLINWQFFVVVA